MFGSSPSWNSFFKRTACNLSLLALIGSGAVTAQLNNETSPTHQFKSVGTSIGLEDIMCEVMAMGFAHGNFVTYVLTAGLLRSDPTCTHP